MGRIERGNHFLSGFGNEDYLQDFAMGRGSDRSPVVNISENEKQYKVEMSVPGYEKDELSIEVNETTLIISASRKAEKQDTKDVYSRREFDYSSFQKTFRMPEHVKVDLIDAHCKNGILELIIPKDEAVNKESNMIEIK